MITADVFKRTLLFYASPPSYKGGRAQIWVRFSFLRKIFQFFSWVPGVDKLTLSMSIKKWEFILSVFEELETWIDMRDADVGGGGARTCALCWIFNDAYYDHIVSEGNNCDGCPVSARTGEGYCRNTPYMEGYDEGKGKERAEKELEFLRSLR